MIGKYSAFHCKNYLLYQVYLHAQKVLNELDINPIHPIQEPLAMHDYNEGYDSFYIEMFFSDIVTSLSDTIICDENYDSELKDVMDTIDNAMREVDFSLFVTSEFHFSKLYDNLSLFSDEDRIIWTQKMRRLFQSVNIEVMSYMDFYDSYIEHNFIGLGTLPYELRERMEYTYVFVTHTEVEFGQRDETISGIGSFVSFAKAYVAFYKELEEAINERERGEQIA